MARTKSGRNPKDGGKSLAIMLAPQEHAEIKAAADRMALTPVQFMRFAALQHARRPETRS